LGLDKKEAKQALKASRLDFKRNMGQSLAILANLRTKRSDTFEGFSK
jgi:hypothetical protein